MQDFFARGTIRTSWVTTLSASIRHDIKSFVTTRATLPDVVDAPPAREARHCEHLEMLKTARQGVCLKIKQLT
jgi:hypothetical protein